MQGLCEKGKRIDRERTKAHRALCSEVGQPLWTWLWQQQQWCLNRRIQWALLHAIASESWRKEECDYYLLIKTVKESFRNDKFVTTFWIDSIEFDLVCRRYENRFILMSGKSMWCFFHLTASADSFLSFLLSTVWSPQAGAWLLNITLIAWWNHSTSNFSELCVWMSTVCSSPRSSTLHGLHPPSSYYRDSGIDIWAFVQFIIWFCTPLAMIWHDIWQWRCMAKW